MKDAINFTVCYVPGEDLLAAAYREQPDLFYKALQGRVIIATPATLMAICWSVNYGSRTPARGRARLGRRGIELHRRLGIMTDHLIKMGDALNKATGIYNGLVVSLEQRVLPQARKLEELGIAASDRCLPEIQASQAHARPVAAERYPVAPEPNADQGIPT